MMTTYQMNSNELNYDFIDEIKKKFRDKTIIIDVYQNDESDTKIEKITKPGIIRRIKDIEQNINIITPDISFK